VIIMLLAQAASNLPSASSAFDTSISALEHSISALERCVSALESSIKVFEDRSLFWEKLPPWFTGLVVLGVLMELWGIRREYREDMEAWALTHFGVHRLPMKPLRRDVLIDVVSVVFVAIGIVGELGVGLKIATINNQIRGASAVLRSKNEALRSDSDQLLTLVTKKVGTVAANAQLAQGSIDAVTTKADILSARIDEESLKLKVLRPRWQILAENADKFIRDLEPFNTTRLTVLSCGVGISPPEQYGTEQRLLNLLGKPTPRSSAANWETGYEPWQGCANTNFSNLDVVFSADASEGVAKAARALTDELLGIDIAAQLHPVPMQQRQLWELTFGPDCPEARALRDPSRIFLLVAPSSLSGAKPSKSRKTKSKR